MNSRVLILLLAAHYWGVFAANARLSPEDSGKLPPPASRPIRFEQDVKPILEVSCVKCHGRGKVRGGFQMDTRESFLKPADSGPAVVVGKSAESYLIELVSGLNPDSVMPEKGSKLTSEQVGVLRAWIDQGLVWDSGISFAKKPAPNLTPRRPSLPSVAKGVNHPIDRFVVEYFNRHGVAPGGLVEDGTFARRVFLDVIGLLPTSAELDGFVKDTKPDKRERLVKRLLSDNQRYAQHWLTFWNDALRNDYAGTGYIDGGRKQITGWLYSALANNMPYDRFVSELINPNRDSEGFTKGIVWRGAVNSSQTPPLQAAQNISQVFLGANLKCASCHDSFINDWTLADAYGLANIYSDDPLEMFQCDKPTGKKAPTRFIFSELGAIDSTLPKADRLERLSQIMCDRKDGRLSRTIVNRLWARLMGRGLIEPVDDMEQPSWHPDLLDWLAEDLADHRFDLKRTLALILTSRAYQMPSVNLDELQHADYAFSGPSVRRLTSEQFRDAIGGVTGTWHERADGEFDFLAGTGKGPAPMLARNLKPQWIWNSTNAYEGAPAGSVYFRRTVRLNERVTEATVVCAADNKFTLYVNGNRVGEGSDWERPRMLDIKPFLLRGENVISIEVANTGDKPSPAGLLFYARARHAAKAGGSERIMDFASDGQWVCTTNKVEGWERPNVADSSWQNARELDASLYEKPKGRHLTHRFSSILTAPMIQGKARAALVRADPLALALGRPNREQVIMTRASSATTLQALELTNGQTLDALLRRGAEQLLTTTNVPRSVLVNDLFKRALGRLPTATELESSHALLGEPVKPDGLQDLLWSIAMLPEFQLIY